MSSITTRFLNSFDDPILGTEQWEKLLASGDTDTVFLTWQWQRAWWESFGRGDLLLIIAQRANQIVALAPLFSEAGMIFFVGSGGSDYLDFVGDISDPEILYELLKTASEQVPDFLGFRFYLVPDTSHTGQRLQEVASQLNLICFDEGSLPAPALAIAAQPEVAHAAIHKKSLVRHENSFRRDGRLRVQHLQNGVDILPHLSIFFHQHIKRWEKTPYPSLFLNQNQRDFYQRLTCIAARTGWLRFTRLDWEDRPIAFHFGFSYHGSFLWYKPSFAIDLARRSPGEVLLRQLLLAAIAEGAETFDFGIGDEAFKQRFATHVNYVRTWGLYPSEVCDGKTGGKDNT
jgi:CelD/BcsL family acetyltransferase involved in cellulose biosynthesis